MISLEAGKFIREWSTGPWLRLAHIDRYSSIPVLKKESVAEHSFFTALYAYVLALQTGANVNDVLARAVVHDLDEALTGDFIRPFKYSSPDLKKILHESVDYALTRALAGYSIGHIIKLKWCKAKDDSLEGQIVHLADLWSVVVYARREYILGNNFARSILDEVATWLASADWCKALAPYAQAISALARNAADEFEGKHVRLGAIKELQDPYHEDLVTRRKP